LVGGWQVIGVRREVNPLDQGESETRDELGLYVTSRPREQPTDAEMLKVIRGHWSAIENGTHHRRDVTLGEDACRVAPRRAANVLASFPTPAIGVYELEKNQQRTNADALPSCCQTRTFGPALAARRH